MGLLLRLIPMTENQFAKLHYQVKGAAEGFDKQPRI